MRGPLAIGERVDQVRGGAGGRLILEYGDYECPYSRRAYRAIQTVERELGASVRFAFRHFPLTEVHPHAMAASAAAEAASLQGRFWEMHDLLFHRQDALDDEHLRAYAAELGLDADGFARDQESRSVHDRITRDIRSGDATGEVLGTPTLFIDGTVYRGPHEVEALAAALRRPSGATA